MELPEKEISCGYEIKIKKRGTSISLLRRILRTLSDFSQRERCPRFLAIITDSKGIRSLWAYDRTGSMLPDYDECIRNVSLNQDGEIYARLSYGIRVTTNDTK